MLHSGKSIKVTMRIIMAVFFTVTIMGGIAGAQTPGGFSVRAIIPDNQVDTKQTYFDLRMRPGDDQTVEVVITNSHDEELTADISLNAASTGRNGLLVYTEPNVRDEIMKVSITDVAAIGTGRVIVPPHASRTIPVRIKMPEEPITGTILGGIAVTGGGYGSEVQGPQQGVSIINKITYVIAIKLTEDDSITPADFALTAITPELVNFKTAVVATLQNKSARIVKDMEVKAQLFRKGSDTMLSELVCGSAEMAPLSSGRFVLDNKNKPIDQGTYRLKMTADYDGRTWVWDEEFTIGTEAVNINNGAVGLIRDYSWLYFLLGAVTLTIVWFAAYRSGRRRKPNEG